MKNRISKLLRHRAALPVVLLLVAAIIGGTASAVFTLSHRAKRVIAAYSAGGQLFSSNYLLSGENLHYKTMYMGAGDETVNAVITICNFAQENPERFNDKAITYTLKAELKTFDSHAYLVDYDTDIQGVAITPLNSVSKISDWTWSGSLGARAESVHLYQITLPKAMLEANAYLLLTATPDGEELQPISALFNVAIRTESSLLSSWTMELTDDTSNSFSDYSGYNFRVSGSGKGRITITWDADQLTLNQWADNLIQAYAVGPDVTQPGRLVFGVDSDRVNSYDLQFYAGPDFSLDDWDDLDINANAAAGGLTFAFE